MKALFLTLALLVAPLASAAAEPSEASDDGGDWRVVMVAVSTQAWDAIRYNAATGKAAVIVDGKWEPIKEPKGAEPLPRSRYEVHMVPLAQNWGALRMDLRSGRSWRATPEGWQEIGGAP